MRECFLNSALMTIRMPVDVRDKRSRIAQGTRRSRSYLAAEAISAYVDREWSILERIERGLADVAAGRTIPHAEAMAELRAIVDEVARSKANRQ